MVLIAVAYSVFMRVFVWGIQPEVPFGGSPKGNIPVDKAIFRYNPPGLLGDGPTFAIYQVQTFDVEGWTKAYNEAGLNVLCSDPLDRPSLWRRGPLKDARYIRAFEYVASGANGAYKVQDVVKRFPWRSWVRSDSVWFNFREMSGSKKTDGSFSIRGGNIWILDAKNHRLYIMGASA